MFFFSLKDVMVKEKKNKQIGEKKNKKKRKSYCSYIIVEVK